MNQKNLSTITYIIAKRGGATVTELMKLCYLADLVAVRNGNQRFTDFNYVRWYYGPFDKDIYTCLNDLATRDVIESCIEYTAKGTEAETYKQKGADLKEDMGLSEEEQRMLDALLGEVSSFGAAGLTEIAYNTDPMKALGVKIGDNKDIGKAIDLSIAI
jgi:hypothetical protein